MLRKLDKLTLAAAGCLLFAQSAPAQTPPTVPLPEYRVVSDAVANQTPVATFTMPVSGLRFEPRVDVQGRNSAEAQADVAIRGGIFENSGFRLGALNVYDPQTGHYFAELPVPPAMLGAPRVLTGARNALAGGNASVGTIAYAWKPIASRGELSLAAGDHNLARGSFYQGVRRETGNSGSWYGADVDAAMSSGDGTLAGGDHDFSRLSGRVQFGTAQSQTDVFAGYQAKFFGWPNLYTPFGFQESENLQTVLLAANHRWGDAAGNRIEAAAYYRRNKDDYEFNRAVPGASNPFLHTTWVRGVALEGTRVLGDFSVDVGAHLTRDKLVSTALTAGRYRERTFGKFSVAPGWHWTGENGGGSVRAGASYDDSNRDSGALAPLLAAEWTTAQGDRWALEYAETTQLPTYTALNSSATAGLFRGNPNLDRSTSRNLELSTRVRRAEWELEASVFQRWDDELVDWTFRNGVVARTANAVDISTTGVEIVARRGWQELDLVLAYTWLTKDADYGLALVDASFYALNFPKHRVTAAVVWRFLPGFELRADNELRLQEDNPLRVTGGDDAITTSVGLHYLPPRWPGWEASVMVDNLWDSDFQEVPAVPASGRQWAVGITRRW